MRTPISAAPVSGDSLPGRRSVQAGFTILEILIAIVVLLVSGMTPFRAVFLATMLAILLSFVRRETALKPRRLITVPRLLSSSKKARRRRQRTTI